MQAFVSQAVEFVSAHRAWAPVIIFLLALGETTALVSLIFPSTAILLGVGALVAAGALDFLPLFAGAALGALAGSSISYWLGRRYGSEIMDRWPLNRNPRLTERASAAFAKWGAGAVLLGHFIGPLRSVAFVMAGIATMRIALFQLANVPGAIAWAFVIPKTGEYGSGALGAAWRALTGG